MAPQLILQVSAALLLVTLGLYLGVNAREARRESAESQAALAGGNGFALADSVTFGLQIPNKAVGRSVEGSGNWGLVEPTPGASGSTRGW